MMRDDDWIRCRRKQSLPVITYFPSNYLEGIKEFTKTCVTDIHRRASEIGNIEF
jgi:hypothetical protein